MPTRVYIQSEHFSDIRLVEITDHATIEDLKQAALALLPPGTAMSDLVLSVEDDDEGFHANATHVADLKKEHGTRVHLHRCEQVEVKVRFGADVVHQHFRPATTVGRVRIWAGQKLGMQPGDVAEHVLQLDGSSEQPDVDTHLGSLTKFPQCTVTFDLVPAHRING